MSLAPFSALESRLNSAVQKHIANATAVHNGGAPFGVLFDRSPADPFGTGAVDSARHDVSFVAANAPGLAEGGTLVIDGAAYTVASGVQPDAGGWVTLSVYPKAA
ncbi:MAG TPA: hypothetical protein DET46_06690 [Comamonadaceae bacterium]|nr:MAG: hypothetical protein A3F76_07735 [Burkholderiales bacterium RIFCSPLOWO2_12_FULL_65_40]HCE28484.1 hypothetical protein [Comamonadaceae bacterium]